MPFVTIFTHLAGRMIRAPSLLHFIFDDDIHDEFIKSSHSRENGNPGSELAQETTGYPLSRV